MSFISEIITENLIELLRVLTDMDAPIMMSAMGRAIFARIPILFIISFGTGMPR